MNTMDFACVSKKTRTNNILNAWFVDENNLTALEEYYK